MSSLASIPGWMIVICAFMFMGPVMRMVFGGGKMPPPRKWEKFGRGEVQRLEAEMAQRDAVIEDLQQRLSEMESRLDFTERMIASRSEVS